MDYESQQNQIRHPSDRLLAHDHIACIGLFILLSFSFPRRQEDEEET